MKYFSMFSGIGGFELGIQQAYEATRNLNVQAVGGGETVEARELQEAGKGLHPISSETALSLTDRDYEHANRSFDEGQPNCIGYSEIDKYAIQIYERHFNHKNYGDATTINASELPDFDLLVGGFPCQAFSIAGKRGGLDDTRGTLFYDIARIAKEKRPQHLLLENVKGLLSHDNGRTFKLIISTFAELGYNLEWQVLNSKNFGVPQNRERVFIIGHLGRCCGRQVFPIGRNGEKNTMEDSVRPIHTIFKATEKLSDAFRIGEVGDVANTLKGLGGGMGAKTGLWHVGDYKVRRLTPTECERLQAYPDGWTEGVSDTQRYKTLGNGVTVNVVREIISRLYDNDRHDSRISKERS